MRFLPNYGRNEDGEWFCRLTVASGRAVFDIGLFLGSLSIRAAGPILERVLVPFGLLWNASHGARMVMLVACPLVVSFMWRSSAERSRA